MGVMVYGAVVMGVCLYLLLRQNDQRFVQQSSTPDTTDDRVDINLGDFLLDPSEDKTEDHAMNCVNDFATAYPDALEDVSGREIAKEQNRTFYTNAVNEVMEISNELDAALPMSDSVEYAHLPTTPCLVSACADDELCLVRDGRIQLGAWARSGWTKGDIARELDSLGYKSIRQVQKLVIPCMGVAASEVAAPQGNSAENATTAGIINIT